MAKSQTSTSTSTTKLPAWMEKAGPEVYGYAKDFYQTPYQPYTGNRVAGFAGDQTTGFGGVRDFVTGFQDNTAGNIATANAYGAAPAQQVGTERVVDQSGRLGAISDYINPYLDSALAPAIRDIETAGGKERNRIGAMATSSGAFGDARHGILESDASRQTQTAIGDVSGQARAAAYESAMGQRANDLVRMLTTDTANAGYNEAALARQLTGAQNSQQMQSQGQADALTRWMSLLTTGGLQQQNEQNKLDTNYEAYQAQQKDAYDRLATLVGSLGGIPHGSTTTEKTTTPTNPIMTLFGSLLGGAGSGIGTGIGSLFSAAPLIAPVV